MFYLSVFLPYQTGKTYNIGGLFAGGGDGVAVEVVVESAVAAVVFSSPVDVVGDLNHELARHEVEVAVSVVSGKAVEVGALELEVGCERV